MTILPSHVTIIITGATASGKSQMALELAQKYQGLIINADSLQVYQEIPLLSSQPSHVDLLKAPHRLYGFLPSHQSCTAQMWSEMAMESIRFCRQQKKLPLIVGGTGFYIKALTEGLSPIPSPSDEIRKAAQNHYETIGKEAFEQEVNHFDPYLSKKDQYRLLRAWEVFHSSGKPLSWWQNQPRKVLSSDSHYIYVCLDPPREQLIEKANQRFDKMIKEGGVEEIKALIETYISRTNSVFMAIGARPLADYLENKVSWEKAIERSYISLRQYIKRQQTWFHHQLKNPYFIHDFCSKESLRSVESVLKELY